MVYSPATGGTISKQDFMSLTLPQLWALLEASDPDNKSDQNEATATSFSDAMTKAREQLNNAT